MSTTLAVTASASLQGSYQGTSGLTTPQAPINQQASVGMGNTQGNATKVYSGQRTTTGETLVLNNGSLTDPLGNSLTFSTVQCLYIQNLSTTGQTLTVGGGSSAFIAAVAISAGGFIELVTSLPAGTGNQNLQVAVSSGTLTYNLWIIG